MEEAKEYALSRFFGRNRAASRERDRRAGRGTATNQRGASSGVRTILDPPTILVWCLGLNFCHGQPDKTLPVKHHLLRKAEKGK
ncbi:hypothetical protein MLD38_021833 [Melastoma candidum]|uniref:Uncharacterized protein n=1 Tax=Melastoma candidum TaxID=119954 RepID=A0ACB9QH95_9MYRT|nr:hypothetical protein MLD38_021833 [Melastoma candidum]